MTTESRHRLETTIRALTALTVVLLVLLNVASLAFLVQSAQSTNKVQETIADCATPGGECYERGRAATADAVGQIIAGVDDLSKDREQSAAQIRDAIKRLCAAQNITCPTLNP